MLFSTTPLYALAVSLIYMILWFRVTSFRGTHGISIGDNGESALLLRTRQHGNCAEWSSFLLILMILAEGMGVSPVFLHITGILLLTGRVSHPFGLKIDNVGHPLRYIGNGSNILAALVVMGCLAARLSGH